MHHREGRNVPGPIHLPAHHRGLCLLPRHKCHHYRPNTPVCIFVLPATRRSRPWRNSSTILGPITKHAGSLSNTASNDVLRFFFPFSLSSRLVTAHFLTTSFWPSTPALGKWRRVGFRTTRLHSPTLQVPGPGIYHHIDTSPFPFLPPPPTNSHPSSRICLPVTQSHASPPPLSCLVLLYAITPSPPPVITRFHLLNDETELSRYLFLLVSAYQRKVHVYLPHSHIRPIRDAFVRITIFLRLLRATFPPAYRRSPLIPFCIR